MKESLELAQRVAVIETETSSGYREKNFTTYSDFQDF
jgi:hypothetical protein